MRKILHYTAVVLGLFFITLNVQAQAPENFTKAKEIAKERIYYDQNQKSQGTIYCGCDWEWVGKSGGRVNLASCGYKVRAQQTRAERIEWEHIVPAWVFGHQRQCWQNGGRTNCVKNDPVFGKIEADLHNLAPSIGEVNGDRSNFSFGQLPAQASYQYGQCRSRVDFASRTFEPRNEVKGLVARVYFYLHDRYNLSMSRQQQQLLMAWDNAYPPTAWEKERDNRIARIVGYHNPFVTGQMKWQLGHKNSGAGLSATSSAPVTKAKTETPKQLNTSQSEDIKGNINSKIYHFAHCSGYKTMSDKNAVFFKTESEAIKAGYRLANNCKQP
ncbi:endonuclease [Proteus terrae]|uniref:endonuclease n=1 Tax=Proteus terrae TaxID=1574161 RepID=UPI0013E05D47|nr:endonuclease [Proteus terrae]QIF98281.1 endonuclease I [Proteus terrae subsp. cibarius]